MTALKRAERDAVTRLRAAVLDLIAAKRFTESNDVLAIIERIDPPLRGEAAGSGLPAARAGRSESSNGAPLPSTAPATSWQSLIESEGLTTYVTDACRNCGGKLAVHCTTHLLPCCPGSLMHGQDEGTWTPTDLGPR